MPYKKIVFIKLFLSLFEEDDRFLYVLNDRQQLLFIKLLYLCGVSGGKICSCFTYIRHKIHYPSRKQTLMKDLMKIQEVFPKFTQHDGYYTFTNFEELHNYIPGNSQGVPKEYSGIRQNKNKKKNKNKKEDYTADTKGLLTYFSSLYREKFGKGYASSAPRRDCGILKKLSIELGEEEFKSRIRDFFELDNWYTQSNGHSVKGLQYNINNIPKVRYVKPLE